MDDQAPIETVNVIIAGGREFDDIGLLFSSMNALKGLWYDKAVVILSGGAKGADTIGEDWAAQQGFPVEEHHPDYEKYKHSPRYAPLMRNQEMAEAGDVLVAFWDGKSNGTRHMIGQAMRQGLDVHIFRYDGSEG